MKRICLSPFYWFAFIGLMLISSCKTEDPNKPKLLPILTTTAITKITQNTATTGGNITSDNGLEVSARGVCWSLKPNPTIKDSITKDAAGTGEFVSNISNLIADTTYYLRAYATNSDGTAYGLQVTFKTLAALLPILTTKAATDITMSTAKSGGIITFNGGTSITVRGVCWSTTVNPTINNDKTSDGNESGSFTSNLSGLSDGKIYYLRAYATNSVGTTYGDQVSFVTLSKNVTDIDGNIYKTVAIGTQTWMAENLKTTKYNDGTAIPMVTDVTAWASLTSGAYCFYNNDPTVNKSIYGALYNWYAVKTAKLAPIGWHVPTDAEWTTLENYLSANLGTSGSVAKALAGTINWSNAASSGAIGNDLTKNNNSGFSALPGGICSSGHRTFGYMGDNGYWWSSTQGNADFVWARILEYNLSIVSRFSVYSMADGFSVRCLKD